MFDQNTEARQPFLIKIYLAVNIWELMDIEFED